MAGDDSTAVAVPPSGLTSCGQPWSGPPYPRIGCLTRAGGFIGTRLRAVGMAAVLLSGVGSVGARPALASPLPAGAHAGEVSHGDAGRPRMATGTGAAARRLVVRLTG